MEMWLYEHSIRPGCVFKAPLLLICLLQGSEMRADYLNIFDALFSRIFFLMPTHNEPDACLSLSRSRDSALFITRFINLNANWFYKGLSAWGPTPVSPRWLSVRARVTRVRVLCTCWSSEWHVLTARASPACLSAWSAAPIRFEGSQPGETSDEEAEKRKKKKWRPAKRRWEPRGCLQGLVVKHIGRWRA